MRSSGPGVTVEEEEEEGEGGGASTTHAGEEGTADPTWTSKGQSQNDIKLTEISTNFFLKNKLKGTFALCQQKVHF